MKIGITGSTGLLGLHARVHLHAAKGKYQTSLATRETFASESALDQFVSGVDAILHFAGVNRGDEVDIGNVQIAERLTRSLRRTNARPAIAYANSIHSSRDTAYGRGKRQAGEILEEWGRESGARVGNFVLPHVFGEFGRPFYNSVVSTFCYQLAYNGRPKVDVDGALELLHAQNVVRELVAWLGHTSQPTGPIRLQGEALTTNELLERLSVLRDRYMNDGVVPNLDASLDLSLYNTLRSYLFPHAYPHRLTLRTDARGELFEAIRTDNGGQVFLSTTVPGITRGNHWHMRKVERFIVIGGEAVVRIRRLFSDDVVSFQLSGSSPAFVDIPTMHVHSLTNTGDQSLQTLFWSNEIFDPESPDTYAEPVLT